MTLDFRAQGWFFPGCEGSAIVRKTKNKKLAQDKRQSESVRTLMILESDS